MEWKVWKFQCPRTSDLANNLSYDFKNKKIGVIGGGSSSIQIVPKLQQVEGANLKCFVRSRTYIGKPYGEATATKLKADGLTSEYFSNHTTDLKT